MTHHAISVVRQYRVHHTFFASVIDLSHQGEKYGKSHMYTQQIYGPSNVQGSGEIYKKISQIHSEDVIAPGYNREFRETSWDGHNQRSKPTGQLYLPRPTLELELSLPFIANAFDDAGNAALAQCYNSQGRRQICCRQMSFAGSWIAWSDGVISCGKWNSVVGYEVIFSYRDPSPSAVNFMSVGSAESFSAYWIIPHQYYDTGIQLHFSYLSIFVTRCILFVFRVYVLLAQPTVKYNLLVYYQEWF